MLIARIPEFLRAFMGFGSRLMPEGMRGKKRLGMLRHDPATRYAQLFTPFHSNARPAMYTPEYFALVGEHDPYARLINQFRHISHLDTVRQLQYVDVRAYLTDDILVKVDKASMFNSLETRSPLLDQHLAEYVSSLPSTMTARNGVLKYLLKKAAADILPAEILQRPKHGFAVPIKHWFRGDLTNYAHDLLDSARARQRGIFNPQFVGSLLQAHAHSRLVNHSDAIWALLCLELWFQVYMDQAGVPVGQGAPIQVSSSR